MEPVAVEFPLRGEWNAVNTPGHRVPSHGTHLFGQTYAYDFIQRDWNFPKSYRVTSKPTLLALLFGVPLNECMAWSKPFYAPFPGEVVEAEDGVKEREPAHVVRDLFVVLKNGVDFITFNKAKSNKDLSYVLGNYIILRGDDAYALFGHARNGSICVKAGERVTAGQKLAEVGHSGNSTTPHLHFQLMDRPELLQAQGIPCCFRDYEVFADGAWQEVSRGIPKREDRLRKLDQRLAG
jgi:hypothetical protein